MTRWTAAFRRPASAWTSSIWWRSPSTSTTQVRTWCRSRASAWPKAVRQSSSPPAEQLSPGELRVLRYLPTSLSRPEIAGELSVSPNTVNAHLRSIYAKLGVRDRSSAVRRARELRLLAAAGRTQ